MPENDWLEWFCLVTKNSVYEVFAGRPALLKVAHKEGVSSGIKIGEVIDGGNVLIIGEWGRISYVEGPLGDKIQRELIVLQTQFWLGYTSPIVGLFTERADAMDCHYQDSRLFCDPRWKLNTIQVLLQIGLNHPSIIISNLPTFRLMPKTEWQA